MVPIATRSLCAALLLAAFSTTASAQSSRAPAAQNAGPVAWVRPLIGTKASKRGYGGTLPSVARPFGMTHFTPVTRPHGIGKLPYWWYDKTIEGFLATHQPAPWMGDYGYVKVMPGHGEVRIHNPLPYAHEEETSQPHLYQVRLAPEASPIDVAVAATERAGLMRFDFAEKTTAPHVVLEAIRSTSFEGTATVDPKRREIYGENPDRHSAHLGPALSKFRGYYVARFDTAFESHGTWQGGSLKPDAKDVKGGHVGAYVTFRDGTRKVHVKIATSFISVDQARRNLDQEMPGWRVETVAAAGARAWNAALSRVKVEGGSDDDRIRFYSALYHTLLFPRIFSEGGRYASAFDEKVHNGVAYSDYSLWDTFRAQHPLLTLTAPERVDGMITSLLQMYDEGGRLPLWPNPTETNIMIGTHADCVIADALVKGFRGFDANKAWQAIKKNAFEPPVGDERYRFEDRMAWSGKAAPPDGTGYESRAGLTWYRSLGFVPYDKTAESVSRTIEYSVDDHCAAQVARHVGAPELPLLEKGARNWRNVFDPKQRMPKPRDVNGKWFDGGNYAWPTDAEQGHPGFTEGGAWTYTFGAMHDVAGLVDAIGGKDAFLSHLNRNFDEGHHKHDNEPGHHFPYLYGYVGEPSHTELRVRQLMDAHYGADPGGLSGDDDCGQMSAWFVFSALGFYPVEPASGRYALGVPLFSRVTIDLGKPYRKGKLVIEAQGLSAEKPWVKDVTLNGKPLNDAFVTHAELVRGQTVLRFVMGDKRR